MQAMASRASDASGRERRERTPIPSQRNLLLLLALTSLFGSSAAGQDGGGLYSGLERSSLENGLEVWTLPRPRTETVALRLVVHTGFRDESADDYGLAHFTEHWMFTDSAEHSEDEVKALITDLGGRWNGVTHLDWTIYQADLLAGDLERGLRWLAEILGTCRFNPALEDRVRREVREEYRNSYAVLPAGLEWVRRLSGWGTSVDRASALLFPDSTVVLRSTRLGPVLDSLGVEQARRVWQSRYVASDMTLVVVGRVEPKSVLQAARRHLGALRAGARPDPALRRTPGRAGKLIVVRESMPCLRSERALALALRTDGRRSTERTAGMLALRVLRDRLERELIDERSILETLPFLRIEAADAGVALLYSIHDAGRADSVRSSFEQQAAALVSRGPDAAELEQARFEVEGALLRGTEDNPDLAQDLAELASAFRVDEPLPDPLVELRSLDREGVATAATRLLAPENQLWLVWEPAFSLLHAGFGLVGLAAGAFLWSRWRRRRRRLRAAAAVLLVLGTSGAVRARAEALPFEHETLPGGPELWLSPAPDSRTAAAELVIRAGSRDEPAERAGAAELLREMLLSGGRAGDEHQTRTALERLGGRWWCWGDKEVTHLGAHVPAERLGDALQWLCDVAGGPSFPDKKLDAHRALAIEGLRRDELFDLLWFGGRLDRLADASLYAGCGLARDGRGDAASLNALTAEDLRRLHSALYGRASMTLVIVAPMGIEQAATLAASRLGGLRESAGRPARARCELPEAAPEPLLVVSRAPQLTGRTPVRVGYPTLGAADPDLWALNVARTMLAKTAFETLRNRLGLVYGARAVLDTASDRGLLYLEAEGEPASRPAMLAAMQAMLQELAKRASPDEVDRAKRRLRGSLLRRRDSTLGRLNTLASLAALREPGRPAPDPVAAIGLVLPADVQAAVGRLTARRLFIAYAEPALTGQGLAACLVFGLAATFGLLWWRRRRRRRLVRVGGPAGRDGVSVGVTE
jgi:predicted Zn-dependent peptidase